MKEPDNKKSTAEPELFTLKDAAKILNVSYPFLDRRVRTGSGDIAITRMGGTRMMSRTEIDRIVKEGVK